MKMGIDITIQEPGTLVYETFTVYLSNDKITSVHIIERYKDSQVFEIYLEKTFP